jgi:hypothetical protein
MTTQTVAGVPAERPMAARAQALGSGLSATCCSEYARAVYAATRVWRGDDAPMLLAEQTVVGITAEQPEAAKAQALGVGPQRR